MHKKFAEIYDVFMKNVNYTSWYNFVKNMINSNLKINDKKNRNYTIKVLDLGCGTGEFTYRFFKDGYDVVGIDISDDMLTITEKKVKEKGYNKGFFKNTIELNCANIIDYIHKEEVDVAVCNFDTVNYFNDESDFEKFIRNCYKNIKKGGLLIFDIVTEDIFDEIFENGIFLDEEEEYTSIWRYEQLEEKRYFIEIDLFLKKLETENVYEKYNEQHTKYIFDPEWALNTAISEGFEIVDTASNPEFGESRIFIIMKRV